MSWQVVLAVIVFVALVVAALPSARSYISQVADALRRRAAPRRPASSGVTVIGPDGQEYEVPSGGRGRPSLTDRLEAGGRVRRVVSGAIVALVAIVAIWQLYQILLAPQPDQFVVLVAPFSESGSGVTQTGREVAAALVDRLNSTTGGRVVARSIGAPPADASAALATIGREGADAMIWGEVAPGGMLDRESLQPLLAYHPSGQFAPYGWEGYAGRFEMPSAYALSSAPINGAVVLPPLLAALGDYGAGHVDQAYDIFGQLVDNYSSVAPVLPRAVRGNVLWARGQYRDAADEYRRALDSLSADAGPQAAMLYNNLGAILQDAGDAQAPAAFRQAVAALQGRDLSALRYNLALQALRENNYDQAITALESARSPELLPAGTPAAPLLLTLADTYRLAGQLPQAQAALDAAGQQAPLAANATTVELHNLTATRLDAEVEAERALLGLAEAAGARGPLPWEVEIDAPLPLKVLNDARIGLGRAVDDTQVLSQRWSRLSVAKDAADEPAAGQIATRHALRAQEQLRDRRRWLAGVNIEIERAQGIQEPRGLGVVWAAIVGDRSPLGLARATLEDLVKSRPADVDSLLSLGRSYLLTGDRAKASDYYNRAAAAAPARPEPLYGQALIALKDDQSSEDRAQARALLQRAIDLNPAFFPAREKLAVLAEEDGDWATAIAQRRWLLKNRPSSESQELALELAETLRKSGRSGYAEAERLLLPYANQNDVGALLALSRLYADMDDIQSAQEMLARAERAAPNDPEPAYQLGVLLEQHGDVKGAEAAYKRALDANPTHIQSRLALGALYTGQGSMAAAGEQYRAALNAGANDPAALKQIGTVLLANREYGQAADAFGRALKGPGADADPVLHHGLGQADLGLNRLGDAEKEEQRALELRGGVYPEALVGLGDIALLRGQADQATPRYNTALSQNPRLVGAHIGLGRASAAIGNWSVAEARFRDALAIAPDSPEAHLWLGEALVRTSDPKTAIPEYARALELRPSYPEAYFGLAQAQAEAGQLDLALDNLASALKLRSAYPEALLLQGKIEEQQGNDDAAIAAYGQSIDAKGGVAEPYYRRALLYMRHDRLDDAADDLEKAVGIQPNFPEAHYWLGRAYLAQGQPRPARDELIKANEQRGGNYSDALFYQGLAEEQLGMRSDAVASYQAALAQNSSGEWAGAAQAALERLRQP